MFPRLTLLLAIPVLASGCGYRPVLGTLPPGVEALHVPAVGNSTAHAGLAAPFTSALRKRLARSGVPVTGRREADARLVVEIVDVESDPGMLSAPDGKLVPEDTIWSIRARAELVGRGGGALAEPVWISRRGRAYSGGSVHGEEALGLRRRLELLDDLADAIVTAMFES